MGRLKSRRIENSKDCKYEELKKGRIVNEKECKWKGL